MIFFGHPGGTQVDFSEPAPSCADAACQRFSSAGHTLDTAAFDVNGAQPRRGGRPAARPLRCERSAQGAQRRVSGGAVPCQRQPLQARPRRILFQRKVEGDACGVERCGTARQEASEGQQHEQISGPVSACGGASALCVGRQQSAPPASLMPHPSAFNTSSGQVGWRSASAMASTPVGNGNG